MGRDQRLERVQALYDLTDSAREQDLLVRCRSIVWAARDRALRANVDEALALIDEARDLVDSKGDPTGPRVRVLAGVPTRWVAV